jgi:undecaprenyl-diphosphatase
MSLRTARLLAATATAVFVILTVVVTTSSAHAIDSLAFRIASDIRSPALDRAARLVTTLGVIAIVGPALVVGAALLLRCGHRARAAALVVGCALEWCAVWITKYVVDRPRPANPLVVSAGSSYPSAHAANSVGWVALALAIGVLIPTRAGRTAAFAAGALLAVLVGLSRVYLRAHHLTDVLAGEALAVAMYAFAVLGALRWLGPQRPASSATAPTNRSTSDSSL